MDGWDFSFKKGGGGESKSLEEVSTYLLALRDGVNRSFDTNFAAQVLPRLQIGAVPSVVAGKLGYV